MKHTLQPKRITPLLAVAAVGLLLTLPPVLEAQRGRGGAGQGQRTARAAAPIDLTGYWVSLITEDWRFRMRSGRRGEIDRTAIPLNAEGLKVAESWDPGRDVTEGLECKAYGAAGIMRIPGRLHITWAGDNTLQIDTDAGRQTRVLRFGAAPPPTGAPTWQGHSVARWDLPASAARGGPVVEELGRQQQGHGQVVAVTTHMRAGYYFRLDGIPYSEKAVMTEYFTGIREDNGDEYLLVTIFVADPEYLTQPYIRTVHFKREPDGSKWNPRPCNP